MDIRKTELRCDAAAACEVRLNYLIDKVMPEVAPSAPETDKPGVEHHQSRLDAVFGNLAELAPQVAQRSPTRGCAPKRSGPKPCDSQGVHLVTNAATGVPHSRFQPGAPRLGFTTYKLDKQASADTLEEGSVLSFVNTIRKQKGKRKLDGDGAADEAVFGLKQRKRPSLSTRRTDFGGVPAKISLPSHDFDDTEIVHSIIQRDRNKPTVVPVQSISTELPGSSDIPTPTAQAPKFRRVKAKARQPRQRICSSSGNIQSEDE
mmetsp:Transcript_55915/g.110745  ORF Transcript_55915/g.110745 Transcript_55915/m.110745 type:complete len:261 (+) Transcript_55915:2-784(+)